MHSPLPLPDDDHLHVKGTASVLQSAQLAARADGPRQLTLRGPDFWCVIIAIHDHILRAETRSAEVQIPGGPTGHLEWIGRAALSAMAARHGSRPVEMELVRYVPVLGEALDAGELLSFEAALFAAAVALDEGTPAWALGCMFVLAEPAAATHRDPVSAAHTVRSRAA